MKNRMILIAGAVVLGVVLFGWFLYRFGNVPEPDWNENIPKNPEDIVPEVTTPHLSSGTSDVEENVGNGYDAK